MGEFSKIESLLSSETTDPKLQTELIKLLSDWAELKVQNDLLKQELENLEDILEDYVDEDYITFPNDFFKYETKEMRNLTNKEITKLINGMNQEIIVNQQDPDKIFPHGTYVQQGDTLICKFWHEQDSEEMIFVAKEYYELNIVTE